MKIENPYGDKIDEKQHTVILFINAMLALSEESVLWDLIREEFTRHPVENSVAFIREFQSEAKAGDPLCMQLITKVTELRMQK